MAKPAKGERWLVGVGMPAWLLLNHFGLVVRQAFGGEMAYLVGTAAISKEWRDIDVRVMLDRKAWNRYVGPKGEEINSVRFSGAAGAFALAFSTLGKEMTGLPIDFQLQRQGRANELYGGHVRHALGIEFDRPAA